MIAVPPAAGPGGGGGRLLVHGTTVALGPAAALLRGASGAGKSDLALRFLAGQGQWPVPDLRRALVADDQTWLSVVEGRLIASAPANIAGQMEVRGVGLIDVAWCRAVEVRLVVDLVPTKEVDRLPDHLSRVTLLGCEIVLRTLAGLEASAALKLSVMLAALQP